MMPWGRVDVLNVKKIKLKVTNFVIYCFIFETKLINTTCTQ